MSRICANCKYRYSAKPNIDEYTIASPYACMIGVLPEPCYDGYCQLHIYDGEMDEIKRMEYVVNDLRNDSLIQFAEQLTEKKFNIFERLILEIYMRRK